MPSPAFVQSAFKAAGAVTSSTLAFGSNIAATDFKVAHVLCNNVAGTLGASDNKDGTYNVDVTRTDASVSVVSAITSKPNATAGATTVTFTTTSSAQLRVVIEEFSGVALSSPLDQIGQNDSGSASNTSPDSLASPPTTQPVELVIGHCGLTGTQTITQGTGFTLDAPAGVTRIGAEYLVTSGTGTQDATFSLGAVTGWTCMVATYFTPNANPRGQMQQVSPGISSPC